MAFPVASTRAGLLVSVAASATGPAYAVCMCACRGAVCGLPAWGRNVATSDCSDTRRLYPLHVTDRKSRWPLVEPRAMLLGWAGVTYVIAVVGESGRAGPG